MIAIVEQDTWRLRGFAGSRRQYVHAVKPGKVTIPGRPSADLHPKTAASILQEAGLREMIDYPQLATAYLSISQASTRMAKYFPSRPGQVSTSSCGHRLPHRSKRRAATERYPASPVKLILAFHPCAPFRKSLGPWGGCKAAPGRVLGRPGMTRYRGSLRPCPAYFSRTRITKRLPKRRTSPDL